MKPGAGAIGCLPFGLAGDSQALRGSERSPTDEEGGMEEVWGRERL